MRMTTKRVTLGIEWLERVFSRLWEGETFGAYDTDPAWFAANWEARQTVARLVTQLYRERERREQS